MRAHRGLGGRLVACWWLMLAAGAVPAGEAPRPADANLATVESRLERVGTAVLANGEIDRGPYSKLAPWPRTDGKYLYSGCYPRPARDGDEPGFDRCFMTVDLTDPLRPRRLATVYSYDLERSPEPPRDHIVWSLDYTFPNLPVRAPCRVDWQDAEIAAGRRAPECWDPGWNTHTHYVALGPDGILAVNQERHRAGTSRQANYRGVKFYDVSDPAAPRYLSYWEAPAAAPAAGSGINVAAGGAHHFNFDGRHLYLGTEYAGFVGRILVVLDLVDVRRPRELARWWLPGQRTPEEDAQRDWVQQERFSLPVTKGPDGKWSRFVGMHYVVVEQGRAYLSYHQAGLVVLDVSDPSRPARRAHLNYLLPGADPGEPNAEACRRAAGNREAACGNTHSARIVPGRNLLVVSDEYFTCPFGHMRIFDVEDDSQPRLLSHYVTEYSTACDPKTPRRPADASLFPIRGPSAHIGNALGDDLYLMAWYGDGLRVIDLKDPSRPIDAGHYRYSIGDEWPQAPDGLDGADAYDVIVGPDDLLYVSDGTSGLRVLRYTGAREADR